MTQYPNQFDPSVPPIDPGDGLPPARKSWPLVVGIFSIVWGVLGLLCNGCGLAGSAFQSAMMNMMPQQPGAPQLGPIPDVMKPTPLELGSYGVGLLLALWLIVTGSMLIARKPAARGMHIVYAIAAIVMNIVGGAIAVQKQNAIGEWAKQNPDNEWVKMGQTGGDLGMLMVGLFVLVALTYPVFLLIWFLAVKRNTLELTPREEPVF